jgi:hypothetical protein
MDYTLSLKKRQGVLLDRRDVLAGNFIRALIGGLMKSTHLLFPLSPPKSPAYYGVVKGLGN